MEVPVHTLRTTVMVVVRSFKVAYNNSKATGLHRPDTSSDDSTQKHVTWL